MIVVNARFLTQTMTGVQRFAVETCLLLRQKLGNEVRFVSPSNIIQKEYAELLNVEITGKHYGHLWEQMNLPCYLKKWEIHCCYVYVIQRHFGIKIKLSQCMMLHSWHIRKHSTKRSCIPINL